MPRATAPRRRPVAAVRPQPHGAPHATDRLPSVAPWQLFSVSPLGCSLGVELTFLDELLGVLLLPLVGAAVIMLVALLAARCTLPAEERGVRAVALRPETCTLQLWLLLVLYPSLARTALTPFDCMEVGEVWLLRADPYMRLAADDCLDISTRAR